MAKTRIKTTPTRMQKDALMASAATATAAISKPVVATTCHTVAPLDDVKKRLRHSTAPPKLSQNLSSGTSTIIVTAPKRTNSISSITSTISQISDMNSDTESPPPPIVLTTSTTPTPTPTATKSTRSILNTTHVTAPAPRTLNSLLCKPSTNTTTTTTITSQHPAALRNRKVFMITEKTDEYAGVEASTSTAASGLTTGQKRKMYLIMEENSCGAEDGGEEYGEGEDTISRDAQKYLKRENGLIASAGGTKKLTLFADKADSGTLTEKFEKILPEILNRIQAKETNGVGGGGGGGGAGGAAVLAYDASLPAIATTVTSKLLNGSANLNIIKSEPLSQQQQQQQQYKQQQQQQQPQLQLKQEPYNNKKTTDEKPANERLPITLPPKKNRTKIITTNYNGNSFASNFSDNFNKSTNNVWTNFGNSSNNNANNNNSNNNNNNNSTQKMATPPGQVKQISAATPVIVSAVTLNARQHHQSNNNNNNNSSSSSNKSNNNNTTNHTHNGNNNSSNTCEIKRLASKVTNNNNSNSNSNNTINNTITTTTTTQPNNTNIRYVSHANGGSSSQVGGVVTTMAQVELVPQKNINLSTDFHFLIKMLPKLESIPEPHKNNVKNCIEKIITQNANIFAKQ